MNKKEIILYILSFIYIFSISYILRNYYFNDASFPIDWYLMDLHNNYLYIWSSQFLWTDNLLETLRSTFRFILNETGHYSPRYFYGSIFLIWFFSSLTFLSIFNICTSKKILISLFFVFNPFVLHHLDHFLILQWYYVTPLLIYSYIHYIKNDKVLSYSLLLFIISSFFLWQPHNYSNLIVILLFWNIVTLFLLRKDYIRVLLRNIILLLVTVVVYSFVIIPFITTWHENALVDSSKHFTENLRNKYISKNENIVDIFQVSNLNKLGWLLSNDTTEWMIYINTLNFLWLILSICIWYIIFEYILIWRLIKKDKYSLYLLVWLIVSVYTWMIFKVDFWVVNDLFYKVMPHISVSTDYAIPIFIITIISFFALSRKNLLVYFIIFITQSIVIYSFYYSDMYRIQERENLESMYEESRRLKSDKRIWYEIVFPMQPKQKIDAFTYPISLSIFKFDVFTLRHLSIEQMSAWTRNTIVNDLDLEDFETFSKKYPFKYFLEFEDDRFLNLWKSDWILVKEDVYKNFTLYKNLNFLSIFRLNNYKENPLLNLSFKKINQTKYNLEINNLMSSTNLSFLQSYHSWWDIYIKKKISLWCKIIEFYTDLGQNINECTHMNIFYEKDDLNYLFKEAFSKKDHKKIDNYANAWFIDRQSIIDYVDINYWDQFEDLWYPKDLGDGRIDYRYYIVNKDWSINIQFTLYFRPQIYFLIGIFISVSSLLTLIFAVVFTNVKYIKAPKTPPGSDLIVWE